MPSFGSTSKSRLDTTHPLLQELLLEVVKAFDCSILTGHRTEAVQNQVYADGKSTLQWPKSKHNGQPSLAVDVAPYPIDWQDRDRFHYFAGYVKGLAEGMGIQIRWGGDWDSDYQTKDNNFDDLPHFELLSTTRLEVEAPQSQDDLAMIAHLHDKINRIKDITNE